jgi:hypothetical protein
LGLYLFLNGCREQGRKKEIKKEANPPTVAAGFAGIDTA